MHLKNNVLGDCYISIAAANTVGDRVAALRQFAALYGGRSRLITDLGINESTWTRWMQGRGLSKFDKRLARLKELCAKQHGVSTEIGIACTDNQLVALRATEHPRTELLMFLVRIASAAGYDLTVETYQQLVRDFEQRHVGG